MNVYFTASVSSGREYLTQTQTIIELLKKHGHQIISADVAQEVHKQEINRLQKDVALSAEEIFKRERNEIDIADVIVAEVSQPSMGVGLLIGYALQKKKPVLALLYKDTENKISPLIEGHPSQNLFLEHYSEDNVKNVIKKFFHHLEVNNKRKGKLIVIDGSDASGKKTQVDLLLSYLQKTNHATKYIDFPRYYSSFHGKTVARFLAGEFGGLHEVNPYLASLAYALDRLAAKDDIEEWLFEKNIVIANRYVSSSMAFQTARVPKKDHKNFIKWLYEMEYKEHKLPVEDIVIYLYVPVDIAQQLMNERKDRKYIKGKMKDINESDVQYLKDVEQVYLDLVKKNKHWVKIDCINTEGKLRTREDIHQEVLDVLDKRNLLP